MKDELIKFIDRLKGKNDAILKYSEESTKLGIILPLLQHLGWNPFDISTIYPEYPVRRGKVDYSIRDGKKSKVFIEVKKVSEDLDKHDEQLLQYSFGESVEMAILTNGITWLFYLPQKLGIKWEQRKFFTINIFDQTSNMVARSFIDYLSMENVISGKHVENAENVLINEQTRKLILKTLPDVWEKILTIPHPELIDLIADETEKKCGHRPDGGVIGHFVYRDVLGRKDIPVITTDSIIMKTEENIGISREELRFKFWKELLCRAKQKGVNTHANRSPSTDTWLSAGAGKLGLRLTYFINLKEKTGVGFSINTSKKEKNKKIFDSLFSNKEDIEKEFGESLEWERLTGKKMSRISYFIKKGGIKDSINKWIEIQDAMIDAMDRLAKVFSPYIDNL